MKEKDVVLQFETKEDALMAAVHRFQSLSDSGYVGASLSIHPGNFKFMFVDFEFVRTEHYFYVGCVPSVLIAKIANQNRRDA